MNLSDMTDDQLVERMLTVPEEFPTWEPELRDRAKRAAISALIEKLADIEGGVTPAAYRMRIDGGDFQVTVRRTKPKVVAQVRRNIERVRTAEQCVVVLNGNVLP